MGIARFLLTLVFTAAAITGIPAAADPKPPAGKYLGGRMLVASPAIQDPRFSRTVIYMLEHDDAGALGLVINRVYGDGPLAEFVRGFGIESTSDETLTMHYGGPVEPGALFVIHSSDYKGEGSQPVTGEISFTRQTGVLAAIAEGRGPERWMAVLGYAGWGPGQLDGEIIRGDWTIAPGEADFVFDKDVKTKWDRAVKQSGVAL